LHWAEVLDLTSIELGLRIEPHATVPPFLGERVEDAIHGLLQLTLLLEAALGLIAE